MNDTRTSSQMPTPTPARSATHSRQHSSSSANMFVTRSDAGRSPKGQIRTFNGQDRNSRTNEIPSSEDEDDLDDENSDDESEVTDPVPTRGQRRGVTVIRGGQSRGRPNSGGPIGGGRGSFER